MDTRRVDFETGEGADFKLGKSWEKRNGKKMKQVHDENSNLAAVWGQKKNQPFYRWVRLVSDAFEASGLKLETASRRLGVSPAELEGVLQLAVLSDEKISVIGDEPPPRTVWFALAGMDANGIKRALEALKTRNPSQSPSSVLNAIDGSNERDSRLEKVANLAPKVFKALATKAKKYSLLSDKERKALFSFGTWRARGEPLSERQAAWAHSLILNLIAGGGIKRDSPDGDADLCDELLDNFAENAPPS